MQRIGICSNKVERNEKNSLLKSDAFNSNVNQRSMKSDEPNINALKPMR